METRKRTKIFNVLMAVLIAVIVFCGIMTAGALRGWFSSDGFAYSEDVKGIVNIERSGVGYTLDEKTQLKDGDVIDTGTSSSASVIAGKNTVYISEDTEAEFSGLEKERLDISLVYGPRQERSVQESRGRQLRDQFGRKRIFRQCADRNCRDKCL